MHQVQETVIYVVSVCKERLSFRLLENNLWVLFFVFKNILMNMEQIILNISNQF